MAKIGEVYICEICGKKVTITEDSDYTPYCCGKPMTKI